MNAPRKYTMGRLLGRGGFGEVYAATRHSGEGVTRQVAVKLLRKDLSVPLDAVSRLRDEARALAKLNHPSVVEVIDLLELDGRVSLVTELVDGFDFDAALELGLGTRGSLEALAQVGAALHAAWCEPESSPLRLVHRDLKPANIRVSKHGQVKLLDFGIARFQAEDRESKTKSGILMGSLPYMAPERFEHPDPAPAIDVFGLGCCLFEALGGERLYADMGLRSMLGAATNPETHAAHLAARWGAVGHVSEDLNALLRASLAFDPDARPSAAEFAARAEDLAVTADGPSLKANLHQFHEQPLSEEKGSLEGRELVEGSLHYAPDQTAVPAQGVSTVPRKHEVPSAPPAFPSIPIGAAINSDELSEAQRKQLAAAQTLLQQPSPEESKPSEEATIDAPAPVKEAMGISKGARVEEKDNSMLYIGLAGCALFMGLSVIGVISISMLGVLATLY